MDNLTHTLFAVTLARTPLGRAGRGATAALVIASNAPDVDVVASATGAINYLKWHRGPTHGPLGVLGLGVVVAGIVWGWNRIRDARAAARLKARAAVDAARDDAARGVSRTAAAPFRMLVFISMIGVALHIAMDLPTAYGTRLLSPFDWHWYSVDWLPIVDIYLLMALVAGIGFGQPSADARRRNAAIVLTIMAVNYGIRGAAHYQALALAPRLFGPTLPEPCDRGAMRASLLDRWPAAAPADPPRGRRCLVEIAAMPTFTSPFRWRVIAQLSNAYEIHDIDLLDVRFRRPASDTDVFWRMTLRYPNVWTSAVEKAAASPFAQTFLGFSRFAAARSSVDQDGAAIVRWNDMRFVGGILTLDQPVRSPGPFTLVVHVGADGQIASQTLGR